MRTHSEAMAVVREGDQTIGTWSMWTAPTRFLRELVEQAVEDGEATAQDGGASSATGPEAGSGYPGT